MYTHTVVFTTPTADVVVNIIILQICIAFMLHIGTVAIPKSTNEGRIKENLGATKIKLTPEEMERLRGIDRNERLFLAKPFWKEDDTMETVFDVSQDEAFML